MEYKFLKNFPEPFLEDLATNRVIPFIGAGFSKNADIPDGKTMPDWDQLGRLIAKQISGYQYTGALDALSAFSHEYSRSKLVEKLAEHLNVDSVRPGEAHKSFCELPFELVATTNFDFLIEKGYDLAVKYCRPVVGEDQLSVSQPRYGNALLKLHGDLHHPNRLIITEEDYDGFIDKNPMFSTFLANLLITRTALFIGYSLDDTDFRQIWQLIKDRLGALRRQAYAISVDCSPHEIARYERRGVKVINIPGSKNDYPQILRDVFIELKSYWSKQILSYSTVTEEDPLIQLSLPAGVSNRLCFFSVPFRIISLYRKHVFPLARKYGLVPITADEVISQGDSILAKISALMDRSRIVVSDISSDFTMFELGMAAKRKDIKLLVIKEAGKAIPSDLRDVAYVERSKDAFSDIAFLERIEEFFARVTQGLSADLEIEPNRLLAKKEYRAAVISAITHLEDICRRVLRNKKYGDYRFSMIRLLEYLVKEGQIEESKYAILKEAQHVRNQLVHTSESIHPNTAKKLVREVMDIVQNLEKKYGAEQFDRDND